MTRLKREQSEGLLRVAVLLIATQRYNQATDCLAMARLIDPSHGEVERTLNALTVFR